MIPIEYIFSYWIVLLFIFYYIAPIKAINPFLLLCIALIQQTTSLIYYIYLGISAFTLTIYALTILLLKVIPLYLIRDSKNKWNPVFSLSLFLVYLLYLHYNGTDFIEVYKKLHNSVVKETNDTPFFYYFKKIGINLRSYK